MGFEAKIVADSISPQGHRITSMLVTFPRIILAEFNTHRMLSRNSASSRAIPFKKMVEIVRKNPFIPIRWMKDHKGMQGSEYITNEVQIQLNKTAWIRAMEDNISRASYLNAAEYAGGNVTKQICNRLLEPFMWHTCLVTATEWENFFALRADPAAEIHMQEIARLMLETMNSSVPRRLEAGDWHMPFGDDINDELLWNTMEDHGILLTPGEVKLRIATARCARTSYFTLGDDPVKHNYAADVMLHNTLAGNCHWSPFEHCARAMTELEYSSNIRGEYHTTIDSDGSIVNMEQYTKFKPWSDKWHNNEQGEFKNLYKDIHGWCGNFRGWIQYRKLFTNENRSDPRLIRHT